MKKGEKAIRSVTYVTAHDQQEESEVDEDDDTETRKYRKTVYLFYRTQVEKR